MICEEDIFQFFQELSWKLNQEGYPILDNLRYSFPGIPTYEEIMEDMEQDKELEEICNLEEK